LANNYDAFLRIIMEASNDSKKLRDIFEKYIQAETSEYKYLNAF